MRKTISVIIAITIAFVSCKSNEKNTQVGVPSDGAKITVRGKDGETFYVPKAGNAFTRFFTGVQNDLELTKFSLYSKKWTGGLKNETATLLYAIRNSLVGFSSHYQTATYHVLFTDAARESFQKAVTQYFADFENKTLKRNDRASIKTYGMNACRLEWTSVLTKKATNKGNTKMYFGYEFRDGSPYFSVYVLSAQNETAEDKRSAIDTSVPLHFYFTKAQAKTLSELFSDERIAALLLPYKTKAKEEAKIQAADEY